MDCPQAEPLGTVEYLRQFNRKVAQQRVPLTGGIEPTRRCNLGCAHCYLGRPARREAGQRELSTAQWFSILDQATEAGCLNLLITGGEPLLRHDFAALYRHAKELGLLVTVFTNGTLVNDDVVALFTDLPPRQVEVSVYGATAETHETVTGVPGSFQRCLAGIRRLLGAGIEVGLKTVLMTLNRHEFPAMERMANDLGVKFRFDACIFPCFDGDRAPVALRVPAREAVAVEMADERRRKSWLEFFRRQGAIPPAETLYQCGAGNICFHVDAAGNLRPCLMVPEPSCSLLSRSFADGWQNVIPRLNDLRSRADFGCRSCEKRALCGYCPAFFALESGAEQERSDYLCAIGHHRHEALVGEGLPLQPEGDLDAYQHECETALPEATAAGN